MGLVYDLLSGLVQSNVGRNNVWNKKQIAAGEALLPLRGNSATGAANINNKMSMEIPFELNDKQRNLRPDRSFAFRSASGT